MGQGGLKEVKQDWKCEVVHEVIEYDRRAFENINIEEKIYNHILLFKFKLFILSVLY